MTEDVNDKSFMDESNDTSTNVAEFIRQDTAAKGPEVTIQQYDEERGTFDREEEIIVVTTVVDGETKGFEIAISDDDDPQNIYLVEAEHRLKTLRQDILNIQSEAA